jgi:hypothetical protein
MRGFLSLTAAAIVAGTLVSAAAPASADLLRSNNFQAFDSRVACGVQLKQLGGMSCTSEGVPSKELDGFIELKAHGAPQVGQRGDSPWRRGKLRRLQSGDSWHRAGVRCMIAPVKRPDVIKCLNLDGNGFLIGPNGYKLINPFGG